MRSHHIEKAGGIVCNNNFEIFHVKAEADTNIVIKILKTG